MSSELQARSNPKKIKQLARELLRNTDILIILCEFLDDKEFISFLMVPRINLISYPRSARLPMDFLRRARW
jgi:hypothetical protein